MQKSKERVFIQEVFDRNVRRPTIIIGERQDELRFRFHPGTLGNFARRHSGPNVVESRPPRPCDIWRGPSPGPIVCGSPPGVNKKKIPPPPAPRVLKKFFAAPRWSRL